MLLNHLRAPPLLTPTGSLVYGSSSSLKPESVSPFWNRDDGLMERSGQSYTALPYYRSAPYSRSTAPAGILNLNGSVEQMERNGDAQGILFADQKYREKHMNRGRYRSRKPVEAKQLPKQPMQTPSCL
ncbi:hypothetical protein JCGZ_12569 [Jatropha curcas]|uniref:Uncharacterized protein n=1 Tax=Jatropha curcas TaxID=180498 RepID=A0A067KAR3_JATCU|nr:hypothetical protein JCGZ_12569 [Jatropha curcas]